METENKYKGWVFTWNSTDDDQLPNVSKLVDFLSFHCVDYIFQEESGNAQQRRHFQGAFRTKIRVRFSTLMHMFNQSFPPEDGHDLRYLTLNRMIGTWQESVTYCSKSETRVGNTYSSHSLKRYEGEDIEFLGDKKRRFPWQNTLIDEIFSHDQITIKDSDDRSIMWIFDSKGNSGKSKFVKYLCANNPDIVKISFGTAAQLRSAIISIGIKSVYFIDMPRTITEEDSIPSLVSTLEDLKNGFVVSVFYGKYQQLLMKPPHVIVFSNKTCPVHMLSYDRWRTYEIDKDNKRLEDRYDYF